MGDVAAWGSMILNAVAFFTGDKNSNPVSILPLDFFSQGQKVNRIQYPAGMSLPVQEAVNTCLGYAQGVLSIVDKYLDINFSEDFVSLCKIGFSLSVQVFKLYSRFCRGNMFENAYDIFLIGWVFYIQVIRTGQLQLCLDTVVNKIKQYKKAIIGADFKRIIEDLLKSLKGKLAIKHKPSK